METSRRPSELDHLVPFVRAGIPERDGPSRWARDRAAPVMDPLVGSLIVVYAFDRDDGFHPIAHHDLDRLGIDQATLAAAATDNLINRMAALQLLERPDGCGMVRLDGHLEASVILVPQLWSDIAEILAEEVLVAVPAPDIVLFCGAGDGPAGRALRAARDRALAVGDHALTKDVLRFAAGWWQIEPD